MAIKKWQFISREHLLNHPRMHIVEDTVRLPNGQETTYIRYAPGKANSVAVIAINDKGELLLQKEYSYPPDQVMWQLPGGGGHEGELAEDMANRELAEESGWMAGQCRELGAIHTNNRRSEAVQHVMLCTNLYPAKAEADPEEFIESYWLSETEVRRMMAEGQFSNALLLAGLGLYFAQLDAKI